MRTIYAFTLFTHDRASYPLTQQQKLHIEANIKRGKKLVNVSPDDIVAVSNIARIAKNRITEADIDTSHALPAGRGPEANKDSPGYKSFVAARAKLIEKKSIK